MHSKQGRVDCIVSLEVYWLVKSPKINNNYYTLLLLLLLLCNNKI